MDLHAVALDAIRQNGEDAVFRVAELADQALERCDWDLRKALLDLIKEIEAIERTMPPTRGMH